eukprot:8676773-Pyramimonas_sp.AAC.1
MSKERIFPGELLLAAWAGNTVKANLRERQAIGYNTMPLTSMAVEALGISAPKSAFWAQEHLIPSTIR